MGNNKDWDDIPYVDGDCIRDEDEWNDMIDYIRHSACADFTIYGTCPLTNQAFRFTQSGTDSQMYGGDGAGDDLHIWGNDNATAVNIALLNTGEFQIWDGATEALRVTYAANVTTVYGGTVATDDLLLRANSNFSVPSILMTGAEDIWYSVTGGSKHYFREDANTFLALYEDGTDDIIEGQTVNNDLYLKPNGTGVVKFGTYAAKGAEAFDGFMTIKDAAGNTRKLMTCA